MKYNYQDYKCIKVLIQQSELIKAKQGEEFIVNIKKHHKSKAPIWFGDFVNYQFKPLVTEVKEIKKTLNEHGTILKQHSKDISDIKDVLKRNNLH
jgi:hypothetical protein